MCTQKVAKHRCEQQRDLDSGAANDIWISDNDPDVRTVCCHYLPCIFKSFGAVVGFVVFSPNTIPVTVEVPSIRKPEDGWPIYTLSLYTLVYIHLPVFFLALMYLLMFLQLQTNIGSDAQNLDQLSELRFFDARNVAYFEYWLFFVLNVLERLFLNFGPYLRNGFVIHFYEQGWRKWCQLRLNSSTMHVLLVCWTASHIFPLIFKEMKDLILDPSHWKSEDEDVSDLKHKRLTSDLCWLL